MPHEFGMDGSKPLVAPLQQEAEPMTTEFRIVFLAAMKRQFEWSPDGPFVVAPGGSMALTVTYAPIDEGADAGCLTILNPAPANAAKTRILLAMLQSELAKIVGERLVLTARAIDQGLRRRVDELTPLTMAFIAAAMPCSRTPNRRLRSPHRPRATSPDDATSPSTSCTPANAAPHSSSSAAPASRC